MRKNSLLSFFVLVLAGILFAPCSLSRMMAQDRIPVCPPLNKVQKGVKPLREMIWRMIPSLCRLPFRPLSVKPGEMKLSTVLPC